MGSVSVPVPAVGVLEPATSAGTVGLSTGCYALAGCLSPSSGAFASVVSIVGPSLVRSVRHASLAQLVTTCLLLLQYLHTGFGHATWVWLHKPHRKQDRGFPLVIVRRAPFLRKSRVSHNRALEMAICLSTDRVLQVRYSYVPHLGS